MKVAVHLPRSLHKKAALAAARDGVTLEDFILSVIAEQAGQRAAAGITIEMTVSVARLPTE